MKGDAENDLEGGGDAPTPVDPPKNEGGEPTLHRKPFSNWGAAARREETPSLLRRASQRLKNMFGGKKEGADAEMEIELPAEELIGEPATGDASMAEAPLELQATASEPELISVPDAADTPAGSEGAKEDLKFLWAPAEDAAAGDVSLDAAPVAEPAVEAAPPAKKPGLLGRLFSSKPKEEIPSEIGVEDLALIESTQPIDAASADASEPTQPVDVAGLDAALPMDEAPPEKKGGFFARLMGRDTAPELDAADAAFAAAQDSFAPPAAEPASDAGFASVDDALPVEATQPMDVEPSFDATQPLDAEPTFETTQPLDAVDPRPSGAEAHASYHAMPVYDFDTPKPDDRSTMEVDLPPVDTVDARPTAEVAAASELPAHTAEVERKTDEFEVVDFSETIAEDPEKTAEVARGPGFFKKLFSRTKEVTQIESAVPPPPTANPTFLVTKFRTFYNEVVIYKNQKTDLTAGFATAIVTSYDADLSPEQAAQSLSQRLHQMLELQLAESSWMGGEAQELYPDAQYAMTVLADEMLTYMEWPGQAAWGAHSLELKIFKSAAADVEFFKRVDRLLKNGPQTVGTRDLARVYLLAIASGFRGKYRPFDLHRPLAEYRRRLYEFVYDGDALLLYADDRRIFPEATSATVAGKGVKRFSMAQQWAAILILLLAGYTVISHLAWTRASADLKDIAGRVEQARTSGTNPPDTPNGGGGAR